jgi:hypothetical protein
MKKSIDKSNCSSTKGAVNVSNCKDSSKPSSESRKKEDMSTSEVIHYDDQSPLARITNAVDPTVMQVSRRACKIDSMLHSDPEKYFRENIFQYVVGCTTWIALIQDIMHDSKVVYEFLGQIKTKGLAHVIGVCKDASAWLIDAYNSAKPRDISSISYAGFGWLYPVLCQAEYGKISEILQLLRFLVRFTAVDADAFEAAAYSELLDVNNTRFFVDMCYDGDFAYPERSAKDPDSSNDAYYQHRRTYYIQKIKRYINRFNLDELVDCVVPGLFKWSDGHCSDGKTVVQKIKAFGQRESCLWNNPRFGISNRNIGPIKNRVVTVKPVPKNYKKPRLIFPQDSYSSSYLHQMRVLLQNRLASVAGINLSTQQAKNRDIAILGSTDGRWATIDHSMASDCISWRYYELVFPQKFVDFLSLYRERSLRINGKVYPCRIAFTAGNPVTFVLETMFFLAVAVVATDEAEMYFNLFADKPCIPGDPSYIKFGRPGAYGDDVYIDPRAAGMYFTICEWLGLKVNQDKSFTTGLYRESCGVEAYQGMRLDSIYWPRQIVGNSSKSEDAFLLASLHNRVNYPTPKWYLRKVTQLLCPRMTTQVGNLYSDLQSYEVPTLCCAPSSTDGLDPTSMDPGDARIREVHATLKPKYGPYQLDEAMEMFLYVDFLAHGPYFEDNLMRGLGCSSPKYSREALYSEGEMKLNFIQV